MRIVLALLLLAAVPANAQDTHLTDFSRFNKAVGDEVAIIDLDGNVREGVLKSVSEMDLTMQFASGEKVFQRDAISGGDRLRDRTGDGAIKGAVFGALVGLLYLGAYDNLSEAAAPYMTSVAVYAGIGWLFDASQTHRETIYRATPKPPLKVSLRF